MDTVRSLLVSISGEVGRIKVLPGWFKPDVETFIHIQMFNFDIRDLWSSRVDHRGLWFDILTGVLPYRVVGAKHIPHQRLGESLSALLEDLTEFYYKILRGLQGFP